MFRDEKAEGEYSYHISHGDETEKMLADIEHQVDEIARIEPLIKWLETKDAAETYDFMACRSCLFTQYVAAKGIKTPVGHPAWHRLHENYRGVAAHYPQTFGAALKRAKEGKFEFSFLTSHT